MFKLTKVKMKRLPFSEGGYIGPTQSTATLEKRVSVRGISPIGIFGTFPFGKRVIGWCDGAG